MTRRQAARSTPSAGSHRRSTRCRLRTGAADRRTGSGQCARGRRRRRRRQHLDGRGRRPHRADRPRRQAAVVADTGGRPLGLAVARDGRLLVCDSYRGLLRMDPASGKFETLVEEVDGRHAEVLLERHRNIRRHNLFHRVDERVHTTSTTRARYWRPRPAAACSGAIPTAPSPTLVRRAVLRQRRDTDRRRVGAGVRRDTGARLSKYWLTGPQAGTVTPLVANLPGHPDNISTGRRRPDLGGDGVAERNAAVQWLAPRAPIAAQAAVAAARPAAARHPSRRCGPSRSIPTAAQSVAELRTEHPVVRAGHRRRGGRRPAVDGLHRSPQPSHTTDL